MQQQSKRIAKLPEDTRTHLRSTQIITSLPQVVSELVQNALDAGALHIDVGINHDEWTCFVSDDGSGISKDGLSMLAICGEQGRYQSSKIREAETSIHSTFGFRGEALSSIASLSSLEISSRTSKCGETWSIIIKGNKIMYNGPAIRWSRSASGTVVCVRECFYNVPVRRTSHVSAGKTLEQVSKDIESYSLVFPKVAFSLENTSKAKQDVGKGRVLTIPKHDSCLSRFSHLFGSALVENVERVSASLADLELDGFISCEGSLSKAYQFFYLNSHPMRDSEIKKMIDRCFLMSTFSKWANDEFGEDSLPGKGGRRSPRKVERCPVYVLNLIVPIKMIDNNVEPSKSSVIIQNRDQVLSFLTEVVGRFLTKCGFSNPNRSKRVGDRDVPESPTKRRQLAGKMATTMPLKHVHGRIIGETQTINSVEFLIQEGLDPRSLETKWTDPSTRQPYLVNLKTGNPYPIHNDPRETNSSVSPHFNGQGLVDKSSLCKPGSGMDGAIRGSRESAPEWIKSALQANNAFSISEPNLSALAPARDDRHEGNSCDWNRRQEEGRLVASHSRWLTNRNEDFSRSFTSRDLRKARIICQVDRKFIACLSTLNSPDGKSRDGTIILIDQHAADERVRVERFLGDLCLGYLKQSIEMDTLDPPIQIVLTMRESSLLMGEGSNARPFLEQWGFHLRSLTDTGERESSIEEGFVQHAVDALPAILSEKLRTGQELQQLIRKILSRVQEEDAVSLRKLPDHDAKKEHSWLSILHRCPKELVDLLNSKACRGAIMFNDTLSLEQCERLISQLAETAFPFKCAHGRPSVIPLVSLDLNSRTGMSSRIDWRAFQGVVLP